MTLRYSWACRKCSGNAAPDVVAPGTRTLLRSLQAAHPALLVEISVLRRAGGVTSAISLVIPVADKLLPRAAVALGDDRVVELLWRDTLEWLSIAWRWSRTRGFLSS